MTKAPDPKEKIITAHAEKPHAEFWQDSGNYFATNFSESNTRSPSAGIGVFHGATARKENIRLFFQ